MKTTSEKIIKIFFVLVVCIMAFNVYLIFNIYQECKSSGGKNCTTKTMREFSGRGYNISVEKE